MKIRIIHAALIGLTLLSQTASAEGKQPVFSFSGDLRLRLEQDWDSQTAAGVARQERTRARIRARLNGKVDLGSGFVIKSRVRTGGDNSQQNANLTFHDFDGNPTDHLKILAEQYSVAWQDKSGGVEVGRMAFPFFTPNEYFWDGDIAPLGVAVNVSVPVFESAKLKLNGGGFKLPAGLRHYSGSLFAGQVVLESGPTTIATGLFGFDADVKDRDRLILLDGNGSRDYTVLAINAQYKLSAAHKPFVLGADFYQNLKHYSNAADAVSLANKNERTGYVLSVAWGATTPGNLQLGYRYFHMERLAVDASYAHDDVARFGTAAQAALTDLKGHDLYANYTINQAFTVGIRTMLVKRLTNIEDGKRARFDIVYKF